MSKPIPLIASLVALLALAACDKTVRGAGQDIRETGKAVEDATR